MKLSAYKGVICAALAVAAGAVYAEVSQTFNVESFDGLTLPGWAGNGNIADLSAQTLPSAGRPISDASDTKALSVEGEVTYDNSDPGDTSAAYTKTEFLLNMTELSDDLSDQMTGYRLAIAAGTNIVSGTTTTEIFCWCKPSGSGSESGAWASVGHADTGTWARVTLLFSRANSTCEISINGIPCVTEFGYLKEDKTGGNGAWYEVAASGTNPGVVTTLEFKGIALVDDVVVAQSVGDSKPAVAVAGEETVTVDTGWSVDVKRQDLVDWGVTPTTIGTVKLNEASGLTVLEAAVCGLNPTESTPFKIEDCTVNGTAVTVKFTGEPPENSWIKVAVKSGDAAPTYLNTTVLSKENGKTTVSCTLPSSGLADAIVIYPEIVGQAAE